MNTRRMLLAGLLIVAFAPPARAQKFGVELVGGYFDLKGAQRSAQAVFGSSGSANSVSRTPFGSRKRWPAPSRMRTRTT